MGACLIRLIFLLTSYRWLDLRSPLPVLPPRGRVAPQAQPAAMGARRDKLPTLMALPSTPPGPHPCVHLNTFAPNNMRGQCSGTCQNAQQRGRVCYWTQTTAQSCQFFEARHRPERVAASVIATARR